MSSSPLLSSVDNTCQPTIVVDAGDSAQQEPMRRSANYKPNVWSDDYIQSLNGNSTETEENMANRMETLKDNIRKLLNHEKKEAEKQLQLIDHLQQLGVAYHFKDNIKGALASISACIQDKGLLLKDNLHATSLLFRLLRENGITVSQDIFNSFIDERGCFKSSLKDQLKGMLSLYEASYYAKEGEVVMNEAMDFTTKHLRSLLQKGSLEPHLKQQVAHALELPLNWRMQRFHARWFIEACQRKYTNNAPLLLEFARVDFNMVQDIHKKELAQLSRWWADLGITKKLQFFRDRLTQNYVWTVGWAFEPQFWSCREFQTKANCFVAMLDDVYDVYGTLEELEFFTDAIERWDVNAIDKLPEYMKLCFLAVFNMANEAAYKVIRDKGLDITPYLKRAWRDLCKAFLLEAKWYHGGYEPSLEEYLENGWVSASGHVCMTYAYCMSPYLTKEDLERFSSGYPKNVELSSMNCRLYNDVVTYSAEMERGDASSSIYCMMKEMGVSEVEARETAKGMIKANWRGLNGDRACNSNNLFEEAFKNAGVNLSRTAQFFYQHEDGYGKADGDTKDRVTLLLFDPIKP